jgi:hypothetical protein
MQRRRFFLSLLSLPALTSAAIVTGLPTPAASRAPETELPEFSRHSRAHVLHDLVAKHCGGINPDLVLEVNQEYVVAACNLGSSGYLLSAWKDGGQAPTGILLTAEQTQILLRALEASEPAVPRWDLDVGDQPIGHPYVVFDRGRDNGPVDWGALTYRKVTTRTGWFSFETQIKVSIWKGQHEELGYVLSRKNLERLARRFPVV